MSQATPDTVEFETTLPAPPRPPAAAPAPKPTPAVPVYPDMRRASTDPRVLDSFAGDVARPTRGAMGDYLGHGGTNGRRR